MGREMTARKSRLPLSYEGAEILAKFVDAHPGMSVSHIADRLGVTRKRVADVRDAFGIHIPTNYHSRETSARPLIAGLFNALTAKGVTSKQIAKELQRSEFFIHGVRIGKTEPRLFDIECLATLAGMKLVVVKADD